jgi:hypothetical protein
MGPEQASQAQQVAFFGDEWNFEFSHLDREITRRQQTIQTPNTRILPPTIVDSAKLTKSRERQRRHLRCGSSTTNRGWSHAPEGAD